MKTQSSGEQHLGDSQRAIEIIFFCTPKFMRTEDIELKMR